MGRHDKASGRILQFGKRAKKKANFHTAANKLPMKITFLRMHIS